MLTPEQNERLTRVGAGTPMGELMRRYWHPIAAYSELKQNPTKAVRLLGEDLVLYEDRSGTLGLIEASCAHRRVHLLYGIPEHNGLRCPYHGWLYDETGQCLEMPAESPDSTFPTRVKIKSYPVQQLGGLVFGYLGPQPTPLLPRYYPFVEEGRVRVIGWTTVACNWLQIMENSLDPVHGEYLHGYFTNYVLERLGVLKDRGDVYFEKKFVPNPDMPYWRTGAREMIHEKAAVSRFEHGVLKHRLLRDEQPETSPGWQHGHPVVIPNLEQGTGGHNFQIRVPMDDTHTYYLYYYARLPDEGEDTNQNPEDIPYYKVPQPGVDENGLPIWGQLDNNSGQDNLAWTSQGPIMARWKERLGQSDVGLIMYRRMLLEQTEIVEDGGEPMNVFRDPGKNEIVWLPYDRMDEDVGTTKRRRATRGKIGSGSSSKFNPMNIEAAAKAGLPLPPPFPPSARTVTEFAPG